MDLSALQKFVDEEIAALGEDYPEPLKDDPPGEENEILGIVPEDLRLLFGRTQQLSKDYADLYKAQATACMLRTCSDEGHAETAAKLAALNNRRQKLRDVFWIELENRLNIPLGTNLRLCGDWQVVVVQDDEEEKPGLESTIDVIAIGMPMSERPGGLFGSPLGGRRRP